MKTDVIIVGSGASGLSSAVSVLEEGSDATVIEKGSRIGGSTRLSAGIVWTYESFEKLREDIPNGKREIQKIIFDDFEDNLNWLESYGITLKDYDIWDYGKGKEVNPDELINKMKDYILEEGSKIYKNTAMHELLMDEKGAVKGLYATNSDNERIKFRAGSTILATGGFQGNSELVSKYITPDTENLWLRSNPWSTGDGFSAAKKIGAKITGGLNHFYGHNLVAPPAEFKPTHLKEASQYWGVHGIAVNIKGKRFTDESEDGLEATIPQDTTKQPKNTAFYIADSYLYDEQTPLGKVGTMIERAKNKFGGPVTKADSLDELAENMMKWGVVKSVFKSNLINTVKGFNQAMEKRSGDKLTPPRLSNKRKIDNPPYYAVKVQPGITFTMGGLDVDINGRVYREYSSTSSIPRFVETPSEGRVAPIPNLYAVGADAGNIHHRHYLGGIAVGLSLGRRAGKHAARNALEKAQERS